MKGKIIMSIKNTRMSDVLIDVEWQSISHGGGIMHINKC